MSLPNSTIMSGFQAAFNSMAGRTTPFIFDEWYCAGFSSEFGASLLARTVLGRKLVFYRTSWGEVVALEDRCAHRSYPLSKGHLENDEIVCGYHGFCYDSQGDCVEVPAMDKPLHHVGVARYLVREFGRIVWIWMGEELPVERAEPPVQPFMVDAGRVRAEQAARRSGQVIEIAAAERA